MIAHLLKYFGLYVLIADSSNTIYDRLPTVSSAKFAKLFTFALQREISSNA